MLAVILVIGMAFCEIENNPLEAASTVLVASENPLNLIPKFKSTLIKQSKETKGAV
ncbi:hypothetical protein PGT21_037016 [Puccinia graminis f. sp. tritici]|uniref:Uncharacterized protein n=1 Tax=Puccinia graminis f. sp. tritici TaxID=56615 RepID=A0A5B0QQK8_PUCGR|nr:hypothetical protein PGT21_037016 [Puccinia graminis f. sp. tritici]